MIAGIHPLMMTPVGAAGSTWNPLDKTASVTLSENNLRATDTGAARGVRSTSSKTAGKSYAEITIVAGAGVSGAVGITLAGSSLTGSGPASDYPSNSVWNTTDGWGIFAGGGFADNGYGSTPNGSILGIAFDRAANKVWFALNGTWLNSGNPATGAGGYTLPAGAAFLACQPGNGSMRVNFGASAFSYSPPSGFTAWG